MSRIFLDPQLTAKHGKTLRAIAITRISTIHQDPRSNDDQFDLVRRWVDDRYDGPIDWTRISGQGSGETLDREQVAEAERLVETGQFDLVILEDLSRHLRRIHAVIFCELCEDKSTRLIAINDSIDTTKDWRLHALFASIKNEQYNRDTSNRIKRSHRNRFTQGGIVQTVVYGYVKPNGTKSDAELSKDPDAQPIYDEWFRRLEEGQSFSEVADWLNENNVPTGPYCRSRKWTCKMVGRVMRNPILKGIRERNRKVSRRVNSTGKYRSENADESDLLRRECPHLAFIEPARFDRVQQLLQDRNAIYSPCKNGVDARKGRPKRRSDWPGGHVVCGICGNPFRYDGLADKKHMLCRGASEYTCWNSITLNGPVAAEKMLAAVLDEVERLPGFDAELIAAVSTEVSQWGSAHAARVAAAVREVAKLQSASDKLSAAIQLGDPPQRLVNDMRKNELELAEAIAAKAVIEAEQPPVCELPTIDELKRIARGALLNVQASPSELGTLMKSLIPEIRVFPVRLCDGGLISLRAKFALSLVPLLSVNQRTDAVQKCLSVEMEVDLFERPQRERFRSQVISMRQAGMTESVIANALGITKTAAQYAAALNRKMVELGLSDPYVAILNPPDDYGKLRRHRHSRYRFRRVETGGENTPA